MTRSNAREIAVHLIYAMQCSGEDVEQLLSERLEEDYYDLLAQESDVYAERPDGKKLAYIRRVVRGVHEHQAELDQALSRYSERWSLSRISSLARAIIELAMFEALYLDDVPMNAAIHEAVLLAKKYEEADTVSFVNGVLGAFSRQQNEQPPSDGEGAC